MILEDVYKRQVRFNEVTTPPEINDFDYEYRVNTEVITLSLIHI